MQESLKPIDSGSRTKELEFREVPLPDMADFKVIFVKYEYIDYNHLIIVKLSSIFFLYVTISS